MSISHQDTIVKKTTSFSATDWKSGCGFAFGSCLVDEGQCVKWKLQITQQENSGNLWPCIGTCEDKKRYKFMKNMEEGTRSHTFKNCYSLAWDGKKYIEYRRNSHLKGRPYCDQLKLGDIE